MQTEKITIAKELDVNWRHGKRRNRLIIICHGFNSSNQNDTLLSIEKGLAAAGHDTLTFNFSPNLKGFDIGHQVDDIIQITDHFADYKQFVLLAASFGALTAAVAATKLDKLSALITLNGFFGKVALGKQYRKSYIKFRTAALAVPKYRRILRFYKTELRPAAITAPVLVMHSTADQAVYSSQSRWFYKRLKSPKTFLDLTPSDHKITADTDRKKVIGAINQWLAELT